MTESEVLKEEGRYRVRLEPDTGPFNPRKEFEHIDHVITINPDRWNKIDEDSGPLADIWERCLMSNLGWSTTHPGPWRWSEAVDLFERYCRIYSRAVTLYDTPYDGSNAVWYLMAEDLHDTNDPAEYLKAQRDEYRSYAEGDVWGYVVEEKTLWRKVDPTTDDPAYLEEREEWEETDDSAWGFIGRAYAEQEALEALDWFVKEKEGVNGR